MYNLDFTDLAPVEVPVSIKAKDDHLLVEATEDVACKYRNATLKAAKMEDAKIIGMDGLSDAEPILVAGCLLKMPGRTPVDVKYVRSLGAKIVKPLFECAKEISDLDEKETKERKAVLPAFSRPDAPVELDALRAWLKLATEEDSNVKPLYDIFKEAEEKVKNSSSATATTSA